MDPTGVNPTAMPTVLLMGFLLGGALGAIGQKSHFCTMGAVADIVSMGSWGRMRMWVLAMATATAGMYALVFAGIADLKHTIYTQAQLNWLSHALGGALFGFGMVLASGCGNKTLIRVGAGNLKSLMVLMVLAISSFMTLKGMFAVVRARWIDTFSLQLGTAQDLPHLLSSALGMDLPVAQGLLGFGLPLLALLWVVRDVQGRQLNTLLGGIGTGAVIVAAWWVSFALSYVPEDPETLSEKFIGSYSNKAEAMSFVAPIAHWLEWMVMFSDKSRVLTWGVAASMGVVLGAFVVAKATKTFRWESFKTAEDTGMHMLGATLMGFGGVTALGCTIGQGVTGISTLSLGSIITVGGIVTGAALAMKWQVWRLERMI